LQAALQTAVGQLTTKGLSASSLVLNVSAEADWERVVATVLEAHRRIDILVQAAGVTGKTGIKTHEVDPANWDFVFAVNARGIFLGARAVLPTMVAARFGRIVNIASVAGKEGNAGMSAYSASKAAVIGLTKCIGKEYAEAGGACQLLLLPPSLVPPPLWGFTEATRVSPLPDASLQTSRATRCPPPSCGRPVRAS